MGYSYSQDDDPKMCFNAAKSWQLGWYDDKKMELALPATGEISWSGRLFGIAEYDMTAANDIVLVKIETGTDLDYYVNFNRKVGFNSGTKEGGDQVLIVASPGNGESYGNSLLEAKLSADQSSPDIIGSGGGFRWSIQVTANTINTTASPAYANITVTATIEQQDVHINCGSPESLNDTANGIIWEPDTGLYNSGDVASPTLSITSPGLPVFLFQKERFDRSNPSTMVYTIPLLNGFYDVKLYFAETYSGAYNNGSRVFDVELEDGEVVWKDVDIYSQVGSATAMVLEEPSFQVTDGALDISFRKINENPKVSKGFRVPMIQRRQNNHTNDCNLFLHPSLSKDQCNQHHIISLGSA